MKTLKESLLDIDSVQSGIDPISLINEWCKENIKGSYKIDSKTLDINSNGDIKITNKELIEFPGYIHFGRVSGDFSCAGCEKLTSLKGSPKKVGEDFSCYYCNSLTSLEGASEKVDGSFMCGRCKNLTSLKGAPKEVGEHFYCFCCENLTSLEGSPEKIGGHFNCCRCNNLTSLEGAPKKVGEIFYCRNCGKQFTEDDIKKVCKSKNIILI